MEIPEAKKALKRAAAALLVKKEETEAEVKALEARAAELRDGATRARAANDAALVADVERARDDVQQRLDLQRDLLSTLEGDLADSLKELRALDGLAERGARAALVSEVSQLSSADPFAPSVEDRALANAREGIMELEARAEVHAELAAEAGRERDLSRRLAALDREDEDAAARAELAALKAARRGATRAPATDAPSATPEEDAEPPKRPKRTL